MSRKLVSVIFFAFLLIGLLNSAKIQPVEVAVCSGYEVNLEKAALFLNSTQFDSAVGLCREAPNAHPNTYWLVSDNLLAYHALKYYYPETAEVVYATMLGYGYLRSFKHEVVFGTTIPYIPFKTNNTYVVAQIGTKLIETEVYNGSSMDDYKEYADLCIYAALHFYWSGNISQAIDYFNTAKNIWNSTLHGVYDKASKDAESKGERLIFSTYKLSLLLYCSRILGQPLEDRTSIEETLWLMQDGEYGGLHTDYDISLNYTGSDMNTETTSIAILAYKYEPKIVNRPLQYLPSLNIPPDYQKIQEAINHANEGDTVFVCNGTYYENVTVSKSIFLLGESRNTTIIDGNGTGTVVRLSANSITVANLTIRNGGHSLGLLPDCCVFGNYYSNALIEDNTIMNASFGVIFYGFSNSTLCRNLVSDCGLCGLHFDGSSTNCKMVNNTVINSLEGIEVEKSAGNFVEGNQLINNNVSIWVDACTGLNVFRNNNMTSDWYNLIVWGRSLENFVQDIDTSNIANNKTVHYITNSHDLLINPSNCPNLGYLAVVNCTNVTVKDIDLSHSRDGLLIAQSTDCTLMNTTISGNRGPLLWGGLTLFASDGNLVINSRISNNSVGVCLYQSNGNLFYHNSFVDVDEPVISNFDWLSSLPSNSSSTNKWDKDFEGNYWSNYNGTDSFGGPYQNVSGNDGIGDTPYSIDANNTDHYPLMGMFSDFNAALEYGVQTVCNSSISDFQFNGTAISFNVVGENGTAGFCRICIPTVLMNSTYRVFVNGTEVPYALLPCSNSTSSYLYFNYTHSTEKVVITPEFPSFLILALYMIATLLTTTIYRKRRIKTSEN